MKRDAESLARAWQKLRANGLPDSFEAAEAGVSLEVMDLLAERLLALTQPERELLEEVQELPASYRNRIIRMDGAPCPED